MFRKFLLVPVVLVIFALAGCSDGQTSVVESAPASQAGSPPGVLVDASNTQGQIAQSVEGGSSGVVDPHLTAPAAGTSYTIVDAGQNRCFDNGQEIPCPSEGEAFYGQDAQYAGVQARYVDNGDGTVTDLNTGLMWQKTPDLYGKVTWADAVAGAETFDLAGYDDWRLPTIKELYSLIDFNGSSALMIPYIDSEYFDFRFGDESLGERTIDGQYWSSTKYVGTTMGGFETIFGVNFADGRIKGYGQPPDRQMTQFVRYVRGNPDYGVNNFVNNGDGTITDRATGLMWMQNDSGSTMNWEGALAYCESLSSGGYSDWRLPNTKELQSIVDYTRSPQTTGTAAIDPLFNVTEVESWYWASTTFLDVGRATEAVYVAFGQAMGVPNGIPIDVHGAGAQRSDPKAGNPADYSNGRGTPGQDDQVRIYNYARCVRGGADLVDVIPSGTQPVDVSQQPPGGEGQPPGGPPPGGGGRPPGSPPPGG